MNSPDFIRQPFEFESPVEFVLIAAVGRGLAVVAKSKGAKLDLIAYAQRKRDSDDKSEQVEPLPFPFPFPYSSVVPKRPILVEAIPSRNLAHDIFDERESKCALVWRGFARTQQRRLVEEEFEMRVNAIISALDENSASRLEWTLAPIIDICHRAFKSRQESRLKQVAFVWFGASIYALGIAIYLLHRFFVKQ